MATSALLVQDDLVLMVKNDGKFLAQNCERTLLTFKIDGEYHLDAAAVCLPGFWRLKEKFRMSLDTLHFEAGVPHYAAKLQKAMNRFMLKLTPDKPVERNNVCSPGLGSWRPNHSNKSLQFFIQLDDGLHWSHRMGDQQGTEVACSLSSLSVVDEANAND